MKTLFFTVLGFAAACGLAGCNTSPQMDYDSVGLVDVSGTVRLDGKPLPNAVVVFESPDGQFSAGVTNDSGRYQLQFDSQASGVTPGEKTVRISTAQKITGVNTEEGSEEAPPGEGSEESGEPAESGGQSKELVPEKYNKRSELKKTVKPDESQTFDFELKSK